MILSLYDAPFVYVQKPTGGRWQHALQLMQDAKGWQIQATWRNMVEGVYWAEHLESIFLDGFWQVSPGNIAACSRSRGFGWYLFKDVFMIRFASFIHPSYIILPYITTIASMGVHSNRRFWCGNQREVNVVMLSAALSALVTWSRPCDIVRPDSEMRGLGFLPPKMGQYGDV